MSSITQHHESVQSLTQKIETKIRSLGDELKKSDLWPVQRKVYKMIEIRLIELRAGLIETLPTDPSNEALKTRILDVLESIDPSLPEAAAWDAADSLKEILPEVASDAYLYTALLEEKARKEPDQHLWQDYFSDTSLNDHIASYEAKNGKFCRALIINRLTSLYKIRNDLGRHDRAREGVRAEYLRQMAWVMTGALIAIVVLWFTITADLYPKTTVQLIVVFVTGAMGAILSRAMRLRDLNLIVELNATWKTLASQAVFGSALAVIVLLILRTGIISIAGLDLKGGDTAVFFVIGLISGYSEPFALGILDKVAAMGR